MSVLVDSSVWIDYFRSGDNSERLDFLIEENFVLINDLILAELVPFLKLKREHRVITLLQCIRRLDISIDWDEISDIQYRCLKNGINGIGIPDLIIAQNAIQNSSPVYSLDNHFLLISRVTELMLY